MILAEELLNLTRKQGITNAEVYQIKSYARPVSFEANRLKQIESNQSDGIALRLWQNNRPGLAVAYGEFTPDDLIAKAIAISELNDPEEILLTSDSKLIYPHQDSTADLPKMIEQGEKAVDVIRNNSPEAIVNLDLEWEQEETTLMNSRGLHCQQTEISYSASIAVELVRGDDFLEVYDGEYGHTPVNLDRCLQSILKKIKWAEKNATCENKKMPVLFTPDGIVSFWYAISEALNGKRILEKSSPWCDVLGQKVMSSALTISQQPDLKPFDCPFDDEGLQTQKLSLIEKGEIKNIYTDRKTAKKLNTSPTGNGFRPSLGTYPTPDLVNLVIEAGDSTATELINNLQEGIIVEQILGEGADISGDFSFNVDLGYLVQDGGVVGRVKDTMITGNIYQVLQQVIGLGNDRLWSGSCYTPSVLFDRLSVIANK